MHKKRRKRGYWNIEKVILELKSFFDIHGRLPRRKDSVISGRSLYTVMIRHGGINYFKKQIGQPIVRNSIGHWDDINKVVDTIKENFPNLINSGLFPTTFMLRSAGIEHIILKHGGVKEVAKVMNCKTRYFVSTDGHYLDSGNELLFDEFLHANGILHEVHGLISEDKSYRYDFKIGDTYIEIWGYEKSSRNKRCIEYNEKREIKEDLYRRLGLKLLSVERDIFQKPVDYIENCFKEILLKCNCQSSINCVVKNYTKFARYWNDESVLNEVRNLIDQIGKFPSLTWLEKNKRYDLTNAIKRNGGISKFRKILECPREPKKKYWNEKRVQEELKNIFKQLGRFPVYSQIPKRLQHQIAKYGGINFLRQTLIVDL